MGPFKCPDCGIWWAGLEHRCRPDEVTTGSKLKITKLQTSGTFVIRCTCPPNRGNSYVGTCPLHDVQVYYTAPTYGTVNT